jgi:hypothetical protein
LRTEGKPDDLRIQSAQLLITHLPDEDLHPRTSETLRPGKGSEGPKVVTIPTRGIFPSCITPISVETWPDKRRPRRDLLGYEKKLERVRRDGYLQVI